MISQNLPPPHPHRQTLRDRPSTPATVWPHPAPSCRWSHGPQGRQHLCPGKTWADGQGWLWKAHSLDKVIPRGASKEWDARGSRVGFHVWSWCCENYDRPLSQLKDEGPLQHKGGGGEQWQEREFWEGVAWLGADGLFVKTSKTPQVTTSASSHSPG